MKKVIFIVISFLLALALSSCPDNGPGRHGGYNEPSIYIGGSFTDGGQKKACYWVNGERHELNGVSVQRITVVGKTVYAAGSYIDNGILKACYWINSTRQDLPGFRIIYGDINFGSISVDRSNVYICGVYDIDGKTCYWVNGIKREPPSDGYMSNVYAANGSVYISGSYTDGGILKPCYWVNGSRRGLPNSITINPVAIGSELTVTNNKTYVFCSFFVSNAGNISSSYWIDGVQQKIITSGVLSGIAVSGGDVYMASEQAGSIYINGELSNIKCNGDSFAVSRGKVYECGIEFKYINGENVYTVCYWVNGERYKLDGSSANAIYVEE